MRDVSVARRARFFPRNLNFKEIGHDAKRSWFGGKQADAHVPTSRGNGGIAVR